MRRLAHYVRPYWLQATVSSVSVTLKSFCDVAGPSWWMMAIDRYMAPTLKSHSAESAAGTLAGHQQPAGADTAGRCLPRHHDAGGFVPGDAAGGYVFAFVQTYLMQWMGQKVMFGLRSKHLSPHAAEWIGVLRRERGGRLVTRLTSDVDAVNDMFTDAFWPL